MNRYRNSTIVLIVINVAVYLFIAVLGFFKGPGGKSLRDLITLYGGVSRYALSSGLIYTPVTALFLHGNFMHILFNMWALFQLGMVVEAVYGKKLYLLFYFVTGIAGGLSAAAFSPALTIGSSSAIFGLVGILFTLGLKKDTPVMLRSITGYSLLPIILINLFLGFSIPGISNAAHIGGLIAGAAIGWFAKPAYARFGRQRRVYTRVTEKSSQEVSQEILIKYLPILNALKNGDSEERTVRLAQLRSELSNLKDEEVASKVLWELFKRDLISKEEFEKLRKFL
ncbi:MAG TPA: rhomboid family intramembrane serine protease [Mesotoga infera]|uniref:Rhomboid family protein n=1 Tax=Mesotoga infera TaxID=1236046 RepID=A0A7Z7LFN3_9BACT|nr:rhomboid family intramembrane serine protease [Mesotoga infera]MBP8659349.1 rhomboid family intramembrane serine protease [Mesotoga sp.]NLI06052.1 rhomboid family intramembrane serine protease [Thermotogaceae bacterium]SSC13157.1 Rhomboid family protein [Mesotoga infera]HNR80454.1 rhomboid family intramembrane serine protease [Mesotoga infera]HON27791.1 rhomboid family intramembrane serine protease [Mesotoga infera]